MKSDWIPKRSKVTLQDVEARQMEVLREIRIQKDIMSGQAKIAINPFSGHTSPIPMIPTFPKLFGTGIAVVDGILIGSKIFKGIRRMFRR